MGGYWFKEKKRVDSGESPHSVEFSCKMVWKGEGWGGRVEKNL